MGLTNRRAFLLGTLAPLPLVACTPSLPLSAERRVDLGVVVRAGQDRTDSPFRVFGGLRIDAKVRPGDTASGLYVIQHTDEAKGGPPRHVHHAQDEWFYVLEGAYRIEVGDQRFDVGPGDSVLAPRGLPHVWAHVSEGEGRLIIAFQPAGHMESFLGALAEMGAAPAPAEMAALFGSHGMTMLGPPLAV